MLPVSRSSLGALLFSVCALYAQTTADPSGHWEGAIQTPDRAVSIEVDLVKGAKGELSGTIGVPEQDLKGLPFQTVSLEGRKLVFVARKDQPFAGAISADGKSISGSLSIGEYSVPVSLTRTGEAKIEAPEKSARIEKELEGTWEGMLTAEGRQLRLVLTMSNQEDGTASGTAIDLDEGGLILPMTIRQSASKILLEFRAIGATFSGTFHPEGSALTGTYTHGSMILPLTLRRKQGN